MLSAIFEEAKLTAKADASVASGDWSNWTTKELDDLVKDGADADALIGKIIRTDRDFPDNLWEALVRYSFEELSGSISSYIIDDEEGKLHLNQSYLDRLDTRTKAGIVKQVGLIARHGKSGGISRVLGSRENGNIRSVRWPDDEIEKAKAFVNKIRTEKATKTRKENRAGHTRTELHPIQTEHWRRMLPDQMPTEVVSWDVIRSKLKTKDKQQIDMVLREMEKNGLITQNEHGNKMFDPAKYQELMAKPKTSYPIKVNKDFRGTYHNAQMIRGIHADAAQISVGLPDATETKWKTEHPKLYSFLKMLRDKKKAGNHSSMMTAKQAIGWVRIDKLSPEDWLIEELQQDIDDIMKPFSGEKLYGAKSMADVYRRKLDSIETMKAIVDGTRNAIPILEKWAKIVEKYEDEWRQWEMTNQRLLKDSFGVRSRDGLPYEYEVPKSFKANNQAFLEAMEAANQAHEFLQGNSWFIAKDVAFLASHLKEYRLPNKVAELENYIEYANKHKAKMDAGESESKEFQEWVRDHAPVKEFLKEFPRMAMHAVKVAAKQHGVKRLWWVTRSQKRILGNANPPISSTSDVLAKKFGFKKVPWEELQGYNDQGFEMILDRMFAMKDDRILNHRTKEEITLDQYLWMVPVDEMVTEARVPLDISLFG